MVVRRPTTKASRGSEFAGKQELLDRSDERLRLFKRRTMAAPGKLDIFRAGDTIRHFPAQDRRGRGIEFAAEDQSGVADGCELRDEIGLRQRPHAAMKASGTTPSSTCRRSSIAADARRDRPGERRDWPQCRNRADPFRTHLVRHRLERFSALRAGNRPPRRSAPAGRTYRHDEWPLRPRSCRRIRWQ